MANPTPPEIAERLKKITPGTWERKGPHPEWTIPMEHPVVRATYRDGEGRKCTAWVAQCQCGGQPNEANAEFIAHAPEDIRTLLALVAQREQEREQVTEMLRQAIHREEALLIENRQLQARLDALEAALKRHCDCFEPEYVTGKSHCACLFGFQNVLLEECAYHRDIRLGRAALTPPASQP